MFTAGCEAVQSAEKPEGIIGTWSQRSVFACEPGGEMEEKNRQTAESLFENELTTYTFLENGTIRLHLVDGDDVSELTGTWKKMKEDTYSMTDSAGVNDILTYDSSDDTLHRVWKSSDGEEMYSEIDFVYKRSDSE